MERIVENEGKARFDARISKEKKVVIERAAILGGYKNLSNFIVTSAYEKARMIIQESETILASQKDSEIFFDALINTPEPNDALLSAARQYKKSGSR